MKTVYMIIGTMLALALCITPVAALTGDDFDIIVSYGDSPWHYYYRLISGDTATRIFTNGTFFMNSVVTFKPANIPDAPVMVVDTDGRRNIYLPQSVDEWEIKYYSRFGESFFANGKPDSKPDDKYLKNAGVFNLNELFGEYISNGSWLKLELSYDEYIYCPDATPNSPEIDIPDVDGSWNWPWEYWVF